MTALAFDAVTTHLQDNGYGFLSRPWPLPRPHFLNNTAKTPDINLGVALFIFFHHLRRHPKKRLLCRNVGLIRINVIRSPGAPEIRDLAMSRLFNEDTIRLQVLE